MRHMSSSQRWDDNTKTQLNSKRQSTHYDVKNTTNDVFSVSDAKPLYSARDTSGSKLEKKIKYSLRDSGSKEREMSR